MANQVYLAVQQQMKIEQENQLITHELSNAHSAGFKPFRMILKPDPHKVGYRKELVFPTVGKLVRNMQKGSFTPTGDPLSMMIVGEGYFSVQTDNGVLYTQDGRFTRNAEGILVTASNHPVLSAGGAQIQLGPGGRNIEVTGDGSIYVDGLPDPVGRIGVVSFEDHDLLEERGKNLYATDQEAVPVANYQIQPGGYESASVDPLHCLTKLIENQRHFERLHKNIELYVDVNKSATDNLITLAANIR